MPLQLTENREILPGVFIKTKVENEKTYCWDIIRGKFVVAGPEEWVRQQIVHYLMNEKAVPKNWISVEKMVKVNDINRRFDVLIFDRSAKPLLIVECKAPAVKINRRTFEQVSRYNLSLKVPYWLLTNGTHHYCCYLSPENNSLKLLDEIPQFQEMLSTR